MEKVTSKKLLHEYAVITKCILLKLPYTEIAKRLNYSLSTISNRASNLFEMYEAKTRSEFIFNVLNKIIMKKEETIIKLEEKIDALKEEKDKMQKLLNDISKKENN